MSASLHAVGRATTAFQPMGPANGGNVITQIVHHSLTANPSANDVFQMIKVPIDAVIVGGWLSLDSTSAFTFTVGDGGDTARYIGGTIPASVSASQTMHLFAQDLSGGVSGCGHKYTATDTIDIKFTAITATTALDFTLCVKYIADGQTGGVVSS